MRRSLAAAVFVASLVAAPFTHAGGTAMRVGAAEDAAKATSLVAAKAKMDLAQLAGLDTIRLTSIWAPGLVAPASDELARLRNAVDAANLDGIRPILAIYQEGSGTTPLTPEARGQFAAYSASLVRSLPSVADVVIGNEPNNNRFWGPQFHEDGTSASPAAYLALLSGAYDAVKAERPGVTVLGGALAPAGGDNPNATKKTHSPTRFLRELGAAYRASGRGRPVMDELAMHAYQDFSDIPPSFLHPSSTTISLPDYGKLVGLLGEAFDGTAQPGSPLPVFYTEFGVETLVPAPLAPAYTGTEVNGRTVAAETQGAYYEEAIKLAHCQTSVRGLLLFLVSDEPRLEGWQSGLRYADDSPKASLAVVRDAAERSRAGTLTTCPDATAPSVELTAPADGTVVGGTVALAAQASDAVGVGKVEFLVNGVVAKSKAVPPYEQTWQSGADGPVTLTARALDGAGNAGTSSVTVTVANPPETTITGHASGGPTPYDSTFTFESSEPGSTFECSLDAAPFAACASPLTYRDLAVGSHHFEVRATDPAGNVDATPAFRDWTVVHPVLLAAGDIAACTSTGDEATAALLDGINGRVITLGDNVYDNGTAQEFANCYAPSWGRHKARTSPAVGNHEYGTPNAQGYFDYFGAAAGEAGKGYYSFGEGTWHVVVLNSMCDQVGGCGPGSPQEQWLRADLAAHPNTCTLAYWHHPRFSSGDFHGNDARTAGLVQALYDHGVDLVLTGHDHHYERFAPLSPSGALDVARGLRHFVVGTGGRSLRTALSVQPWSEVRDWSAFGILKLTLRQDAYDWEFVPVAGESFTDSGSDVCHGSGPATTAYAAEVDADEPIAWWRLGEPVGAATAADRSGNGIHGAYSGAAPGAPGALANDPDTATSFSGLDGDDVVVDDRPELDVGGADFTVEAWVKTTANGGRALASKRLSGQRGWQITVGDVAGRLGHVRFHLHDGAIEHTVWGPPVRVDDGGWHHVAVAVDRDSETAVYVDGLAARGGPLPGDISNAAAFRIGDANVNPSWQGVLDEVALYGSALSHARVLAHLHAGRTGPPPADTTPPETTIASGPRARTTATSAIFAFSAGEPGASFECRRDGGGWEECTSPKAYAGLAIGAHVFDVRATDSTGNADETPATWPWTVVPRPPAAADFDGDGDSDYAVFRPSIGQWRIAGQRIVTYGQAGDVPVPADYDGDRKADVAVFRPSTGQWRVEAQLTVLYGQAGDIPVPADYNGDGKDDIAVFRPSIGQWRIAGQRIVVHGQDGDVPVPADYDGDGRADLAFFRPTTGQWRVAGIATYVYGQQGDIPVPADYDGDGDADLAVFRPSTGQWRVAGQLVLSYGASGDIPVPGEYSSPGRARLAVYRPATGEFRVAGVTIFPYGQPGDVPVIAAPAVRLLFFAP
jgi:hypothetical protein